MMAPLPRRRLLKYLTAVPVALSAVGQTGCSYFSVGGLGSAPMPTRFGNLLSFDEEQAGILFAFAEASLSLSPESLSEASVIQRLDEELYFVSNSIADDFRLALSVMEYMPLAYGEFSRFSRMDLPQRSAFLSAIQHTRIDTVRAVAHSLRMVVMLAYYGHESSWSSIHYSGSFSKIPPQDSIQRAHYRDRLKTRSKVSDSGQKSDVQRGLKV